MEPVDLGLRRTKVTEETRKARRRREGERKGRSWEEEELEDMAEERALVKRGSFFSR